MHNRGLTQTRNNASSLPKNKPLNLNCISVNNLSNSSFIGITKIFNLYSRLLNTVKTFVVCAFFSFSPLLLLFADWKHEEEHFSYFSRYWRFVCEGDFNFGKFLICLFSVFPIIKWFQACLNVYTQCPSKTLMIIYFSYVLELIVFTFNTPRICRDVLTSHIQST